MNSYKVLCLNFVSSLHSKSCTRMKFEMAVRLCHAVAVAVGLCSWLTALLSFPLVQVGRLTVWINMAILLFM